MAVRTNYIESLTYTDRDNSGYGLSQRETTLQCNVVSHWLSPYPGWSWWHDVAPYIHNPDTHANITSTYVYTTDGIFKWLFLKANKCFVNDTQTHHRVATRLTNDMLTSSPLLVVRDGNPPAHYHKGSAMRKDFPCHYDIMITFGMEPVTLCIRAFGNNRFDQYNLK